MKKATVFLIALAATTETRQILGFACKKYTYTFKKIFGEVWLTDQVTMQNDVNDTVSFKGVEMGKAINTVNYYTF